jgi:GNAT superfamily N-acetyltransferase
VDGRLVATVGAFVHPGDETRTVLVGVYVTPAYRGTGTLGALVEAAAEWSRQCGRPTLELEVVTTNGRARRAYTKLGFTDDGPPVPHPTVPTMREQRMARTA